MERSFTSSCPAKERPCRQLSVLLLDDDVAFRSGLAANLRADGHAVYEYASPDELPALAMLPVAVVISDYQMPGMDGLTFAKAFHQAQPAVPIVLLTACEAFGHPNGNEAFVSVRWKPFEYDELHSLLHRLAAADGAQSSVSIC